MKAKVIMPFKDNTANGKTRNPGEVFECDAKRFAEIKKAGRYVVAVEEEKPEKAVKE